MLKFLIYLGIGLLLLVLLLRQFENKLVFFPSRFPDGFWNTSGVAYPLSDHYFMTTDQVRLHGWLATKDRAAATILLMHGNAGNLSHRLDLLAQLLDHVDAEIFIFDYRGYGRSEGKSSEAGIYRDARAAYRYLTETLQRDPHRLILFGQSLGGAVAVDLAREVEAAGLILEATFSSAADMARTLYGFLPVWWIMRIKLDSAAKIGDVRMPKLFIHGSRDEIVPLALGEKLYRLAPVPKRFIIVRDAGHNDVYWVGGASYFSEIAAFVQECTSLWDEREESY